jgi:dolichyl-phosphate-mannose-protein mannosyltransferase
MALGTDLALAARERTTALQRMAARWLLGEWAFVALILALAAVGRIMLAARGWPAFNSDESIVGLMTDDILRHGAHPVFFYGQNYMGALQSYLAVPFFLLLGATPFALQVTATAQTILFILILYLFTREVFSREVALVTLLLLAAGPFSALGAELHVGAGEHDTLLLGALILWLVTLRLRGRGGLRMQLALDAGVGLVIGIALWCDFLILPFALAAALALVIRAAWRVFAERERALRMRLVAEAGVAGLFFLIGLAPLLLANIASGGATFLQVFGVASSPEKQFSPPPPPGPIGVVWALGLQIAATLLVGLPHGMGKNIVCGPCAIWPLPTDGVPAGTLAWTALVSIAFSLFVILCWALMALPLARDVLRDTRRALVAWRERTGARTALSAMSGTYDARWWGRAMLVLGAFGTVAQYALSHVSYFYPIGSARYLVGLFLCAPLVAAPLVAGLRVGSRWAASLFRPSSLPTLRWPPLIGVGASALLIILIALNVSGWQHAFADTSDHAAYGQPTGQRDADLITYLRERQITRFYTDYWTCYKIVFATDQQVSCAVFNDKSVFGRGTTRIKAMSALVTATPHAPYVFDMTKADQRERAQEFAHAIAQSDPRASGYTPTRVGEYEVYTYADG